MAGSGFFCQIAGLAGGTARAGVRQKALADPPIGVAESSGWDKRDWTGSLWHSLGRGITRPMLAKPAETVRLADGEPPT